MEEIIQETRNSPPKKPADAKTGWREFLETEQAVRVIYLIFGFSAILMVMTFLRRGPMRSAAAIGTAIITSNGVR